MEKWTPDTLVKMGLGAMMIAKEKAEEMIEEAIQRGEVSKEEGEKALKSFKEKAEEKSQELEKRIKEEVHEQLKELGVATKEDLASIRREITALKHLLEQKQA